MAKLSLEMLPWIFFWSGSGSFVTFGVHCGWLHGCLLGRAPARWQCHTWLLVDLPWWCHDSCQLLPVWWRGLAFSDGDPPPGFLSHVWTQQPTSSPCRLKGYSPLMWPSHPRGPRQMLSLCSCPSSLYCLLLCACEALLFPSPALAMITISTSVVPYSSPDIFVIKKNSHWSFFSGLMWKGHYLFLIVCFLGF